MSSAYDLSKGKELEQPIPNERVKHWSWIELVKKDGKWCFKKTNHVREYSMTLRQWKEKPELTKVEYVSLESRGVKKKQSLKVIVAREGIDPSSIRKLIGYFVVTMVAEIPNAPENKDLYLTVFKGEKHGRRRVAGHFVINDFAGVHFGYQAMDWTHIWITRLPEERRITEKEAQRMLDENEVADVVSESADGTFNQTRIIKNIRL